jgi:hypothetical protein
MTADVRTLLHTAAAAPSRGPDVEGARRRARDRRRRRRGLGALAAVVVLALATGAFALGNGGGDRARVAIGPRQSAPQVPDGWTTIHADGGFTLAVPPGWDEHDFGDTPVAQKRVSVGTSAPGDTSVVTACTATGQNPTVPGTWLSIWEYPSSAATSEVTLPGGDVGTPGGDGSIPERPADFADAPPVNGRCPFVGNAPAGDLAASFEYFWFRDAGRVFLARTVVAYPPSATPDVEAAPRLFEARQVLDTLRVEPLVASTSTTPTTAPTTSTTAPTTSTVPSIVSTPLPTITTQPPFVPSTTDEQQINDLFVAWLRDHPDDQTRILVEDADALLDAIHQGLAQHTADDLAQYSGTVSAIRMLDDDHAEVQYMLLHAGQSQFGLRTGVAARIDGRWMVSRATECALLSLGGISCPPAS